MDILLDESGDLIVTKQGDIKIGNSVSQKIRIALLWFEDEWRWNKENGLPYQNELFVKNPDIDSFESLVRNKIFEIEEITDVVDVSITYDRANRKATIRYVAKTDLETIRDEVKI